MISLVSGSHALIAVLAAIDLAYITRWALLERASSAARVKAPGPLDVATGFLVNFLDTLGIGSFAIATTIFKARRNVADENIPGTLNAGLAVPTATEGLIYIALVTVGITTLVSMIVAAVAGAWLGARLVSRFSRKAVQLTMGLALLAAAAIYAATSAHWLPAGGQATELHGGVLVFACAMNFILGALMSAGVGLYAPCLILLSLLGMSPIAAFPIMMGSCGCLMPVSGLQFITQRRYDLTAALGLAVGGVPGVLLAAFVVKSLPLDWLRWLVVIVVLYASLAMLRAVLGAAPIRAPRESRA